MVPVSRPRYGKAAVHPQTVGISLVVVASICLLSLLARRISIPSPVLLTAIGIGLGFVPVFPTVKLNPESVLLLVLPPMVYSAAIGLPWEDFRSNFRAISLYAFALVVVSSAAVAFVARLLMPGLSWAEAFALGAVVAPTDPVASTAASEHIGLPQRIKAITQGEGLVNDAVALTTLKLSTAAILTHSFSIGAVFSHFGVIVTGEITYGLFVGWIVSKIRRRITDARVEVAVSLMTPFLAYLLPEALGGSGVIATVAAGMYIGMKAPELVSAETRLSLAGSWDVLTFLLEGSLFFLTGLQFRLLVKGSIETRAGSLLLYGAALTAALVVLRFIWTWLVSVSRRFFFSGTYMPFPHLVYLGWCGMRGGISLAAALSISSGVKDRDEIVFLTACVIAGTLIVQGAPLPLLVRKLGLDQEARDEEQEAAGAERKARVEAINAALHELDSCGSEADRVRQQYSHRLKVLRKGESAEEDLSAAGFRKAAVEITLRGIQAERNCIIGLNRSGKLSQHILHRIERDLDLREARFKAVI